MTEAAPGGIDGRILAVRERIAQACERRGRDPAGVTLIAVSKTWGASAVEAAWHAGIRDFGENRVQEGVAKSEELIARGVRPTWHLIGHLQTNKVRAAVPSFGILHAVDSERLLQAIAAVAEEPIPVFIEVNVAGEATKFGVTPADARSLVRDARGLPGIRLLGLMTVAPAVADPEAVRPVFGRLRDIAKAEGLQHLSMGMTGDFEIAIEEGATHVRVGRAIFGERTA